MRHFCPRPTLLTTPMPFMHRRRALTFIEIIIAMAILTIALLPIFNMIHKGTEDTDLNASQAFAITKASDVLNAMLDN
ncbi:MAG TPA: prepilin-type N-terminal cleavage/methylation domain-containing protein, partial [Candidatus Ozemobacteraceae bacterium]|nr:prepilin-type N-terminal cleavage/methylation domain-containing protein [Candidatus Ozemobacteraceae bacterium]